MKIPIENIYITQKSLKRKHQIEGMIQSLKDGNFLPPIVLIENENGEIQVQDGHHRLMARYLFGQKFLEPQDYIFVRKEFFKPVKGKICHFGRTLRELLG